MEKKKKKRFSRILNLRLLGHLEWERKKEIKRQTYSFITNNTHRSKLVLASIHPFIHLNFENNVFQDDHICLKEREGTQPQLG